ncbi:hypothetical protein N7499_008485 [Penicillium canescens]|nr:hypothetical protein N7522_012434 [Penicillium canescens]KAJ6076504.1 hypothetical protein N7499_008485 [Penicillium canescens]KAJ6158812.1 hypothetical protein N7485_011638 [Penicillium canescens]
MSHPLHHEFSVPRISPTSGHPYTPGELNSIANQGRNSETNVPGDALWLADFSLWAAEHA